MFQKASYCRALLSEISRRSRSFVLATAMCLLAIGPLAAQNRNAGEIRGTVTDQSGAVVPGVAVNLTNTETGVKTEVTTDSAGVYDALGLTPGEFTLAFTKEGFKRFVRSGVILHVEVITVNARLEVGATTQAVTVHANVSAVQTENAVQSLRLTSKVVEYLPNLGNSWWNYFALLPGVNPGGAGGQGTNNYAAGVNGTPGFMATWLQDGGIAANNGANTPDNLQPILGTIAEVNYDTANFGAEYGNGSSVFNVITKSGTNQWHGSLFEFIQNDAFEARNFFAPKRTPYRWNEYGGTVGGPIKHDKAFFFVGYQRNPFIGYSTGFWTYPTMAERNGDFSALLPAVQLYDPNTYNSATNTRQPVPGNILTNAKTPLDNVAAKIVPYIPQPNCGPGLQYNMSVCSPLSNNYYLSSPASNWNHTWDVKVDDNLTSTNHLSGSFTGVWSYNQAVCPGYPQNCSPQNKNEFAAQATDVWNLNPSTVNEFRFGVTWVNLWLLPPDQGMGIPSKIGMINPMSDVMPNITVSGYSGTSFSGAMIGTGLSATLYNQTFVPSDVLTLIKGKHLIKLGGEYDILRNNTTWATLSAGDFGFSGLFTQNPAAPTGTGNGFADFLFGMPQTDNTFISPVSANRQKIPEAFIQDDYKIRHNLTLNIGLRWMHPGGWYDAWNREGNFDPTLMNPATGTLGAICYDTSAATSSAICPVRGAEAGRSQFDPRVGFAWSPRSNWAVRGGYGIYHLQWSQNDNSFIGSLGWGSFRFASSPTGINPIFVLGNQTEPAGIVQGPPPPTVLGPSTRTPDAFNGSTASYSPYYAPSPYMEQWRLDVQHQLQGGVLVDAAYVGTRGVHLNFVRDIGAVPPSLMPNIVSNPANQQNLRPYPQFTGVQTNLFDGYSNYNAFQLSVRKQFSAGFAFIANYTWSHSLDVGTHRGWTGTGSVDRYQQDYNIQANYANSGIDMPNTFSGDVIYDLPVGQGKRFLNQGGVLNGIVGGWRVSSILQFHSGLPFTPVVGSANDSGTLSCCASWFPNRVGSGELSNPTINEWFDPSAFTIPAPGTFGNSGRNILFGPGWKEVDLSLAKNFRIRKLGEGGNLEIRGDAFDAFNHPNFGNPNTSICPGNTCGAGVIGSALINRNIQLGARITF